MPYPTDFARFWLGHTSSCIRSFGESGLFEQNRQLYAGTMPAKTREERILTASYPTATLKTGIYGHGRAVCCVSSQRPSRWPD